MRLAGRSAVLWIVWGAAAVLVTWEPFLWQLGYFKSPGPQFYRLAIGLLLALPAILAAYQWVRHRWLWRYELAAAAALPLAAALFYQGRAALIALWLLLAAYATGRFVRRTLRLDIDSAPEEIAVSTGVGLALLLLALFILGVSGGLYNWSFALLFTVPLAVFWRDAAAIGTSLRRCHAAWTTTAEISTPLGGLLAVFMVISVVSSTLVVLSPSLTYDVLTLHLPAAQYYQTTHAVRPVPNDEYSYFPQAIESLMAFGLAFAGQPGAQILPPLFFALSTMLAFGIARRCGADRLSALGGVVLAATVPAVHWTGSVAKNDFALAFFVLASLDCYLCWQADRNFRWLQLGVFFLAAAMGIKDTVGVALPGAALLYGYAVWRQTRRLRALASLLAIALAFGVLWQVRTFLLTGNPLFPLVSPQKLIAGINTPPVLLARYLRIPWDLQFHGNWYFEGPLQFPLGIVFLLFVPGWFPVRRRPDANERACLAFAVVYLLAWTFFPVRTVRYAVVPVLLLVLLTGCRALGLRPTTNAARLPLLAGLAYCLVFALCGAAILEVNGPLLRLFARRIDSREYLREAYYPYRPLEALRARWHPGDWVYSAGNCAAAYSPDPTRFICVVQLDSRYDPAAVRREIAKRPYRFVLLPTGSLDAAIMGPNAIPLYRDAHFAVYQR